MSRPMPCPGESEVHALRWWPGRRALTPPSGGHVAGRLAVQAQHISMHWSGHMANALQVTTGTPGLPEPRWGEAWCETRRHPSAADVERRAGTAIERGLAPRIVLMSVDMTTTASAVNCSATN